MSDPASLGLATAFLAGIVSFLSPCVLPLVPGYLSYVSGSTLESLRDDRGARVRALGYAACFVLGFGVVFVALGAGATLLGNALLTWRYELSIAAGILVTLFGLHMLGLSPLSLMSRELRWHLDLPGGRIIGAFVMGLAFAFGWTPCIGPVLGVILTMSANAGDLDRGIALLATYAAGLGMPFLAAALFTDLLLDRLRRLGAFGRRLQQVAGALLVVMGILMLTGRLETIAFWLLENFSVFGSIG